MTETWGAFSKGAKLIWKLRSSKDQSVKSALRLTYMPIQTQFTEGCWHPVSSWRLSVGVWVCKLVPAYNSMPSNLQMVDELGFLTEKLIE